MPVTAERAEKGLYEAARQFVERGLIDDDSLFTPGRGIWVPAALDDFHERYVIRGDAGADPFEVKLEGQLEGADGTTTQFVAELLYTHFLAPRDTTAAKKLEHIETALSQLGEPVEVPEELARALEAGVANLGIARNNRYHLVRVLLEFARTVKDLPQPDRAELLRDPWSFKELLFQQDLHRAQAQAEALLHLVHPEHFEPIISQKAKGQIVDTWEDLVEEPDDDRDRRIKQIRSALEPRYGEDFGFYEPRIRAVWQSKDEPWDEFVHWAQKFYEWEGLDDKERDYKLQVTRDLRSVRDAMEQGTSEEWIDRLSSALDTNLPSWRAKDEFVKWCRAHPERAAGALTDLWEGDERVLDRVDRFIDGVEGARIRLVSVLLMYLGAERHPPYATTAFEKAFDLTGHPYPDKNATEGERYRHALAFLDRFLQQARARNLELRDQLDAQSLIWCITKSSRDTAFVEDWNEEEWRRFQVFRGEREPEPRPEEDEGESGISSDETLDELAERLLVDRSFLGRIKRLLQEKGQIIFYGPPGTGKTYVAQELARVLADSPEGHRLVQFHPSYAYEDFVEGYRPSADGGASGFQLRHGPLREMVRQAREHPEEKHVLIIDEINRGNIARVFGELYFLLEYRDREIHLQYSGEGFTLPENLWFIGTMNTADRSIALMDAALRRRFYFMPFFPTEPPIQGLLGRWLDQHAPDLRWVADLVEVANRRLDDPHFAIGPSYFMHEDLTEEWVETVWRHSVLPYLEERFFGDQDALEQFRLDELRAVVEGTAAPTPDDSQSAGMEDAEIETASEL